MPTIPKAFALMFAGLLAASSLPATASGEGEEGVTTMNKPKLFVLGDSISIHYGAFLEKMVASLFEYSRKTGTEPQLKGSKLWGGTMASTPMTVATTLT